LHTLERVSHPAGKGKVINLKGKRFGRLVVQQFHEINHEGRAKWLCLCDCGNTTIVAGSELTRKRGGRGGTSSCGCLKGAIVLAKGEAAFNSLLRNYKARAKRLNIDFALSREEFLTLTRSTCFYCGQQPTRVFHAGRRHKAAFLYNGVDRVNSSKGYEWTNVVPCCETCNKAKRDMDVDEFIVWITRAYNHLKEIAGKE